MTPTTGPKPRYFGVEVIYTLNTLPGRRFPAGTSGIQLVRSCTIVSWWNGWKYIRPYGRISLRSLTLTTLSSHRPAGSARPIPKGSDERKALIKRTYPSLLCAERTRRQSRRPSLKGSGEQSELSEAKQPFRLYSPRSCLLRSPQIHPSRERKCRYS